MNGIRYYSSDPENADNFMEWDVVSGIERIGPSIGGGVISSHYPNLIAGCSSSQPTTSGYFGKKRKCLSSSPLPKKISRNIWNEKQQQEEYVLVNKTNLQINHEVASEFSTTTPVSQMTLVELRDISSQVTSNNKSSLLVNGGIDSSKGDISADVIESTCASCQSRIFCKHRDFNMMRGKIVHPLDRESHIIHNKRKCKICRSKWFRETNLQTHLATNSVDNRSVV